MARASKLFSGRRPRPDGADPDRSGARTSFAAGLPAAEVQQRDLPATLVPLQRAPARQHAPAPAASSAGPPHLLPPALQLAAETLSGVSLAGVMVHSNSPEPGRLQAAAFAQGAHIHLAPGQERQLPHEAWHVVQQRQGRVRATADVAGMPVNADPALEQESDAMAARLPAAGTRPAVGASHMTLPPQPTDLPGPPLRPSAWTVPHPAPSTPVLQARWLVDPSTRELFWEPEPGLPEGGDPPSSLMELKLNPNLPQSGTYEVEGRNRRKRMLVTAATYQASLGSGSSRGPSDVYNPFGRFRAGLGSFYPSSALNPGARDAVLKGLQDKDSSYRPVLSVPKPVVLTRSGYPQTVVVEDDVVLHYEAENDYGAIYGEAGAQTNGMATLDEKRATDPSALGLTTPLDTFRVAVNEQLSADELRAWSGRERSVDQGVVMGASAGDAAQSAGFARNEGKGWEWLHLIAHSMGGMQVKGPQVAENLVAGTSECNSQMIVVEEFLKDYVTTNEGRAALVVQAEMFDARRHIGRTIVYDFEFYNSKNEPVAVYHYRFDALSRRQPMAMENRTQRYSGREALMGGGVAATKHQPRSMPTAHSNTTAFSVDPVDALVHDTLSDLESHPLADFVARLAQRRANNGGTLPSAVFDAMGERLNLQSLGPCLVLLAQQISPKAAERVLWSCLSEQHDLAVLSALWLQVVLVFYGSVEKVPARITELVKVRLAPTKGPQLAIQNDTHMT